MLSWLNLVSYKQKHNQIQTTNLEKQYIYTTTLLWVDITIYNNFMMLLSVNIYIVWLKHMIYPIIFIIHKVVNLPLGKSLNILRLMYFNVLILQVLKYVANMHK